MPHEYGMPVLWNACANQAVVFPFRFNCDIVLLASWMFSERLYASREPPRQLYWNTHISDVTATMFDKVECIHLIGFNSARMRILPVSLTIASSYHSYQVVQHAARNLRFSDLMRCTPAVLNWKIHRSLQDFRLRCIRNNATMCCARIIFFREQWCVQRNLYTNNGFHRNISRDFY